MTFYYDTGMQLYFIQFKLGFHFNGKKVVHLHTMLVNNDA